MDSIDRLCTSRNRAWGFLRPKKKPLILLEVLIALSLTAILLTLLFSFFVESAKIEKKLDKTRMCILHRGHLQTRLQTVFTSIEPKEDRPFFYTEGLEREDFPSLFVLFNNGVDPDPSFSGPILGKIYLDEEKNLSLTTQPLNSEKSRSWRKEILFPKVQTFTFEFLGTQSPTEHGTKEKIYPINANLAWRTLWPRSLQKIPSLIRLKIYEEDTKDPLQFAFLLPIIDPITYHGKEGVL